MNHRGPIPVRDEMKLLVQPDKSLDLNAVVIESERLKLASVDPVYVVEIFYNFTPEITRYMLPAPPQSVVDTQRFVAAARASATQGKELTLTIHARMNAEFLGLCGIHARGRQDEPELGIWLKKSAQKHGYGRETISALRDWADIHLEFEHLLYPVDRRNLPSRRIPETLGGRILRERKEKSQSGTELDELVYAFERRTG